MILRAITRRIDLSASTIAITLSRGGLAKVLQVEIPMDEKRPDNAVMISVPIALRRRGVEPKLVIADPGGLIPAWSAACAVARSPAPCRWAGASAGPSGP